MKIEFTKRGRVRQTATGPIKRWRAIGPHHLAIDYVEGLADLPARYLLIRTANDRDLFVISYHRTKNGAIKRAQKEG